MRKVSVELDWVDAKTLSTLLLHHLVLTKTENKDETRLIERVRMAIRNAHPMMSEKEEKTR